MSDAQHDFVIFVLIAIVCGAVLGAMVTLSGCGGAEFTEIHDEAKADAAAATLEAAPPWREEPVALETAKPDAEARDAAIRDELPIDVNIPDAAPVEADVNPDGINDCDAAACRNGCSGGNARCCTAQGACGCFDFGPVCI